MGTSRKRSKRRQITFRIGRLAQERLHQVAALFNMRPSAYVKALVYKDLGIFNEPLDRRRVKWSRKRGTYTGQDAYGRSTDRSEEEEDEEDIIGFQE